MLQNREKAVMGRPPKLSEEERAEVRQAFVKYIEVEDYPTIAGFCFRNKVAKHYKVYPHNFQDWQDFSNLRQVALKKQELYIDEGALHGKLNAPFAQFKLKQPSFGWHDKSEIEHGGEIKVRPIYGGLSAGSEVQGHIGDTPGLPAPQTD